MSKILNLTAKSSPNKKIKVTRQIRQILLPKFSKITLKRNDQEFVEAVVALEKSCGFEYVNGHLQFRRVGDMWEFLRANISLVSSVTPNNAFVLMTDTNENILRILHTTNQRLIADKHIVVVPAESLDDLGLADKVLFKYDYHAVLALSECEFVAETIKGTPLKNVVGLNHITFDDLAVPANLGLTEDMFTIEQLPLWNGNQFSGTSDSRGVRFCS